MNLNNGVIWLTAKRHGFSLTCTDSPRGTGRNERPLMALPRSQRGSVQLAGSFSSLAPPGVMGKERTLMCCTSSSGSSLPSEYNSVGTKIYDIPNIPQHLSSPESWKPSPGRNMGAAREKGQLLKTSRFLRQPDWPRPPHILSFPRKLETVNHICPWEEITLYTVQTFLPSFMSDCLLDWETFERKDDNWNFT